MENLRIRLTKKMIQDALVDLLEDKKIEKITVMELCKKATINRTTFYKYYGSQYDVLDDMIQNFFDELKERVAMSNEQKLFSKEMLEYLKEQQRFCTIMLDKLPYETFISKLFELSEYDDALKKALSNQYSDKQKECVLRYYQHGCFGIMSYWIHSNESVTVTEIDDIMNKLSQNILFQ